MKLLIVTQYFWPETFVINRIVELLALERVSVTVITGKPNYPGGQIFEGYAAWGGTTEKFDWGDIVRVPILPRGKKSRWRLTLNYLSFIASSALFGPWLLRDKKFDLIFVYAPSPILQAIPAMLFARLRSIPLVVWVQDLWPESLSATGHLKNSRLLAMIAVCVKRIYRGCDRILVQSRSFIPSVVAMTDRAEKVRYFPNPALVGIGCPPTQKARELIEILRQNFCIVFAGNLGSAQGLDVIVETARLLLSNLNIRIVLVGSGSQEPWIEAQKSMHGLSNLILAGRYDSSDMPSIFEASSALLVTLKSTPVFALTVPSKVQSYLAAGRPIVAALDGEGALVIRESGAGLCSPAGDARALAASISHLSRLAPLERKNMGECGQAYFEKNFEPEQLTRDLVEHFRQVIEDRGMTK